MIHSQLTFEESAAALAESATKFEAARKRQADVDTRHADASQALTAATDAHGALAGKIAAGGSLRPADAAAASAAVAGARAQHDLVEGARGIAATAVEAADLAWREARYSHALHGIREARRSRAAALRVLAKAGADFGNALDAASAAGSNLTQAQHDASSAAKLPHLAMMLAPSGFDQSRTSTHLLSRALPGYIIQAVRESMIEHWDFNAEASREEIEAAR